MSLYRSFAVAIAAMGLTMSVFAADEATPSTNSPAANAPQAAAPLQTADNSTQPAASTDATAEPAAADTAKVDINKATVAELKKVKGINTSKAKAIVAYRKKNGDFKSLDQLKEVKGFKKMKDETMKEIQDHLTIG